MSQDPNCAPDSDEFAAVRLRYDPLAKERSPTAEETIHILTPQIRVGEGPDEKTYGGENFGVVEQKVATVLGPMLGKGLIRVDAKVRRGMPNVRPPTSRPAIYIATPRSQLPILPLHFLLFTPKGNIPIVSTYLQNSSLMLDHPRHPFELDHPTHPTHLNQPRLQGILYSNPHNPPPGGFGRSGAFARGGCGPAGAGRGAGWGGARWNSAAPNGKSVEVQRSQVDEMFKNLKCGDDLEETEPSACPLLLSARV